MAIVTIRVKGKNRASIIVNGDSTPLTVEGAYGNNSGVAELDFPVGVNSFVITETPVEEGDERNGIPTKSKPE